MSNIPDNKYNLLSQLAYLGIAHSVKYDNKTGIVNKINYTVGDMAKYYLNNLKETNGIIAMSEHEWHITLHQISKNKNLANLKITGYTNQDSNRNNKSTANNNGLVAYIFAFFH